MTRTHPRRSSLATVIGTLFLVTLFSHGVLAQSAETHLTLPNTQRNNLTLHFDGTSYTLTNDTLSGRAALIAQIATTSIDGDALVIDGGTGDDLLTVEIGATFPAHNIVFNGRTQRTASGDALVIRNATPFVRQTIDFADAVGADGFGGDITIDDGTTQRTITFSGLEPVNAGNAADMILNLPSIDNDATLQNNASADAIELIANGSTFENTIVPNPTNSLTVNLGNQTDTLTIEALDAAFAASLTINGDANDTVTINDDPAPSGLIAFDVTAATTNANADITSTGAQTYNSTLALSTATTLTGSEIDFGGSVTGSSTLRLLPASADANITLGGATDSGAAVLDITASDLAAIADGFASVVIGADNGTGAITISATTFNDPITFAGGLIDIAGHLDAGANEVTLSADVIADSNSSGTDVTGDVTINGSLAPGSSPGQTIVNGDVTLSSTDTFTVEIDGTTAGTGYDQLQVTGANRTVTLGDATLSLVPTITPAANDSFTIIDLVDGTSAIAGTFGGLAEGDFVTTGTDGFFITYTGGDGNDVVLTACSDTITVQNDLDSGTGSLREAIALVCPSGTIDFDAGLNGSTIDTSTSGALVIDKDVTIDGPGAAVIIVSGGGDRVFEIGNHTVQIDGLGIRGGVGIAEPGGGIFNDGNLTLDDVAVYENGTLDEFGGGIASFGVLTMTDSAVYSNTVDGGDGGGIYNEGILSLDNVDIYRNFVAFDPINFTGFGGGLATLGVVEMINSTIYSNTANFDGGGIINAGIVTITTSAIYGNDAIEGFGGGIASFVGSVTISDTLIYNNIADGGDGGGIFNGELMQIDNSAIFSNTAILDGGGNFGEGGGIASYGTLTVTNSAIFGNDADIFGAGISNGDIATVTGTDIYDNITFEGDGGGIGNVGELTLDNVNIYLNLSEDSGFSAGGGISSDGVLTITNSAVFSNTTDFFGGGIVNGFVVTMVGTDVYGNTVLEGNGGGISDFGFLNIDTSNIFSNTAIADAFGDFGEGGGIATEGFVFTMTNSTVYGNSAENDGGGIDQYADEALISNTVIRNNTSGDDGGGIDHDFGILTLDNVTITGNEALDNGGGLDLDDDATINASTITSNSAGNDGGGIDFFDGTLIITNTQILTNTAAGVGGGIWADDVVSISGGAINANQALAGGGLFNVDHATLDGVTVQANSVTFDGGGIWSDDYITVTNSTVISNSADLGGGFYLSFDETIGNAGLSTVSDSTISYNSATTSGGGFYNITGTLYITTSDIISNAAATSGGGLFSTGTVTATVAITNSRILSNSAATGGAYQHAHGTTTISTSCIVANDDLAVNYLDGATVNATDNWWGHPSGPSGVQPGIGDSVSGNVMVTGFRTAAILGCPTVDNPDVSIAKTVTPVAGDTGETITYTLTFSNTTNKSSPVTITDTVPAEVTITNVVSSTFGTNTAGGSVAITQTSDFVWEVSPLAVNAGGIITLTGVVTTDSAAIGQTITNTVEISTTYDTTPANNRATAAFDIVGVSVGVTPSSVAEDGGVNLTYAFTRTGATVDPLTVTFDVGGTAAFGGDYLTSGATTFDGASGSVTFAAGAATTTLAVDPSADTLVELSETVVISLTDGSGYSVSSPDSATGTIANDDSAGVTISDVSALEGDTGTVSLVFAVTLTNAVNSDVFVVYETVDDSATIADSDYNLASGGVTFSAGSTGVQNIIVTVNGDTKVEADETFSVTLTTVMASGYNVTITDADGVGTIENDDDDTAITAQNADQNEGDAGETALTFVISRTGFDSGVNSVNYTVNGTGSDPANADDFGGTFPSGTITFGSDVTETLTISVTGDLTIEPDEQFSVTLSQVTRNLDIITATATGIIRNDDAATVTLTGGAAQDEGNRGATSFVFTATLDTAVTEPFSIAYATNDGTATSADNDYNDNDSTLTFVGNAGETKTIVVSVNGDLKVEADETFSVTLGAVTGALSQTISVDGTPQISTITNDDIAALSIVDVTVDEDVGSALVTVTLSAESTFTTTATYATSDDSATAGDDYTTSSGAITFTAGATHAVITVPIIDDTLDENGEMFDVLLSNPDGAMIADGTGVVTILDNDAQPTITASNQSVSEADGSMTITFTLSAASGLPVGFDYSTVDGSATAPDDYISATGRLTFTAGTTQTTTTVTIINDDIAENSETFIVSLSNPSNAQTRSGVERVYLRTPLIIVTITNDDVANVTVQPTNLVISEGASALFTITLDTQPTAAVSINVSSGDTTECTVAPNPVVLDASNWQTGISVTVTAVQDNVVDGDQPCAVAVGSISSADPFYAPLDPADVDVLVQDVGATAVALRAQSTHTTNLALLLLATLTLSFITLSRIPARTVVHRITTVR